MRVILKGPEDLPANLKKEKEAMTKEEADSETQEKEEEEEEDEDEDSHELIFQDDYDHEYMTQEL